MCSSCHSGPLPLPDAPSSIPINHCSLFAFHQLSGSWNPLGSPPYDQIDGAVVQLGDRRKGKKKKEVPSPLFRPRSESQALPYWSKKLAPIPLESRLCTPFLACRLLNLAPLNLIHIQTRLYPPPSPHCLCSEPQS